MGAKEIRDLILNSFFVIFGCAVLSAHIFTFVTDSGRLAAHYIVVLFAAALVVCLSNFIFYSRRVLATGRMIWRYLLHFVITLAVAAAVGVYMEWISCGRPVWVIVYLLIVSAFYGLMMFVNELRYYAAVREYNEQLRRRFKDTLGIHSQ